MPVSVCQHIPTFRISTNFQLGHTVTTKGNSFVLRQHELYPDEEYALTTVEVCIEFCDW